MKFTLIELVVVFVMIAIIAGVVVNVCGNKQDKTVYKMASPVAAEREQSIINDQHLFINEAGQAVDRILVGQLRDWLRHNKDKRIISIASVSYNDDSTINPTSHFIIVFENIKK